jgi:hypothetical protein
MSHITKEYIGVYVLIPFQKHALAKNACNFSSLMGLVGNLRASRVDAEELKYSSHLILEEGDAFAVAINCSFSKLNSGVIELRV